MTAIHTEQIMPVHDFLCNVSRISLGRWGLVFPVPVAPL